MSAPEPVYAPVALFCYNRPHHLQRTVEALRLNAEAADTELYVFCDGPPDNSRRENTDAVRSYVRSVAGFKNVTVLERETNFGLSRSIVSGVTEIVNVHGRVIVLEDDLVTSPYFLRYMNDGLRVYGDCEKVASIHGYSYAHSHRVPETYFLKGADCYGWGTWKRAWKLFNDDASVLYKTLIDRGLSKEFDWQYPYPYMQLLHDQMNAKHNLWAVRWHASAFLAGMFTLYPRESLAYHIGFDMGTSYNYNCPRFLDPLHVRLSKTPVKVELISEVEVFPQVTAMHQAYLNRFKWLLFYVGIRNRVYRMLNGFRSYGDYLLKGIERRYVKLKWNRHTNITPQYSLALYEGFRFVSNTRHLRCNPSAATEIHTVTGHHHVFMYLLAIKSFLRFYDDVSVVVHDGDGDLTDEDIALLREHIKGIKIVDRKTADETMNRMLTNYPRCGKYRSSVVNSLELLDHSLLATTQKIVSLNSDVLFLRRPDELIQWLTNGANEVIYVHENSPDTQARFLSEVGCDFPPHVTLALVCFEKRIMDLDLIESVLAKSRLVKSRRWVIGQCIYPVLFANSQNEYKIRSFDQVVHEASGRFTADAVFRHYWCSTGMLFDRHMEDAKKVAMEIGNL